MIENNPVYILSVYDCGKTAMNLKRFLQLRTGRNILYLRPGKNNYDYYTKNFPPKIRWGNSQDFGHGYRDTDYNTKETIHIVSSKLRTSRLLFEENISCITFSKNVPNKYPVVIRKRIAGQGGKGIVIATNYKEWEKYSNYWYSYFIPFEYELGVHMLKGEVVKVLKKEIFEGLQEAEFPIRNNDNNYHYKRKDPKFYKDAVLFCENIYNVIPINMTRIDLGYYQGQYFVIEMNSAPSLNTLTLETYGNFLLDNLVI